MMISLQKLSLITFDFQLENRPKRIPHSKSKQTNTCTHIHIHVHANTHTHNENQIICGTIIILTDQRSFSQGKKLN